MTSTEVHDINQRIDGLTKAFNDLRVVVAQNVTQCQPCRAEVEELKVAWFGSQENGSNPGAKVRMDRLEVARARHVWGLRALFLAAASAIAGVIREWVIK